MSFGDTRSPSIPCDAGLAGRLAGLRRELFGDDGGGELARRLGVPARTWSNYEGGVTVPALVVLKIITLLSVEAEWLLSGQGPKFRHARGGRTEGDTSA
ncbi:MAG: helix-turn-helix domain-containing protein [Isosphaeraceae bacterium]